MGTQNQGNQGNRQNPPANRQNIDVLDTLAGKNQPSEADKAKAEKAKELVEKLAKLTPFLTDGAKKVLDMVPDPEHKLAAAEEMFKTIYPNGLGELFGKVLQEQLPAIINKLASEYGVNLDGKRIVATFPGEGKATDVAVGAITDWNKVEAKKSKKGGFGSGEWGESTKTDDKGKTIAYASPSQMAKSLGYRVTQHNTMLDVFTKPIADNDGTKLEQAWEIVSAEKGKGIHIRPYKKA